MLKAIRGAVAQLACSEQGRSTTSMLHTLLTGNGGSPDELNREAVLTVLIFALGSMAGTVKELLAGATAGVQGNG